MNENQDKNRTIDDTTEANDVEFDASAEEVSAEEATSVVKKLKEKIKTLEAEKQEYLLGWQKARADFVNLRKRDEEEKQSFVKFAVGEAVLDIIPILDSFEMAMGNTEAWERVDKNWRQGVEYIYNQLKAALEKHGVTEINPQGKAFEVSEHEAVEHIPVTDKKLDHHIVKVIKCGYRINGKVIRPAQVAVGEYKKTV